MPNQGMESMEEGQEDSFPWGQACFYLERQQGRSKSDNKSVQTCTPNLPGKGGRDRAGAAGSGLLDIQIL